MRLAALNPRLMQSASATQYTHQLDFDCPKCGPPYRIMVNCDINGFKGIRGVWGLTLPAQPSGDGWNGVTLTPSLANVIHGRKKLCGYHCSIRDGEVVP